MKKHAVEIGAEDAYRLKWTVLNRQDTRAQTHALFENAAKSQKRDRRVVESLLVQTPLAQTMAPNLQKVSHVTAFFDQRRYLTEAQRRYPELLKVSSVYNRPAPNLSKRPPPSSPTGATPNRSALSGGGS